MHAPGASRPTRKRVALAIWVAGAVLVTAVLVLQVARAGFAFASWDWLLITGLAVFTVALAFFASLRDEVDQTLHRLREREIIREDPERELGTIEAILARLDHRARWTASIVGVVLAAIMVVVWLLAFGPDVLGWVIFWAEVVLAAIAGAAIGRMIAYGRLGSTLVEAGLEPRPQPGHVDGAAGLQPVGALYLRQAMIVAAILLYAGIWWLLIPGFPQYQRWRDPYILVILVALAFEVVVFFVPLVSFHRVMERARDGFRLEADRLAGEIRAARTRRDASDDPDEIKRLEGSIEAKSARWTELETMPVWPIDSRIRRRFTWSNAVAVAPILVKALASAPWWNALVTFVGEPS